MPYRIANEECQQANGSTGSAMIYKIEEDGSETPVACHVDEESAAIAIQLPSSEYQCGMTRRW